MSEFPDLKGIVFDWGGVLIEDPAQSLLEYCAQELQGDLIQIAPLYQEKLEDLQKGKIAEWQFWEHICKPLDLTPPPLDVSLWKKAVENCFRYQKKVWNLIPRIQKKGLKTGFLSNTEGPAARVFKDNKLNSFFHSTTFSCYHGCAKPEEEIYHIAANSLGLNPWEILLIDDKIENIDGALEAGWHGFHFQDYKQLKKFLKGNKLI